MFVSKWHMHRMGLVDFWYYVNEEFLFKDGHMLLRGSNGSGKSVTMQSFIPLLLDGNKSSERLDSFGTRSRKIENYLLEEEGGRDDRIGYLYLEFKREDADVYKTIGMGLHARRNKPVDAWYFVIEDNRRINYDIQLMEHNLAVTRQVLKNNIQQQFIDNQKEYMDRVNAALFGFSTRDEYKEAIALLMQLRSPKLSNSLKPTIINDILSDSLQPLSEDDLRPMTEAISNMDEIKDQLDALKQSNVAAKVIANIYEQYNHVVLDGKAKAYLYENKMLGSIHKEITGLQSLLTTNHKKEEESKTFLKELRSEQMLLEEEKSSLVGQDILQLVNDIERHNIELENQKKALFSKEIQEEEKDNQRIDVKQDLQTLLNKKDSIYQELISTFEEMEEIQEDIQFEEHAAIRLELLQNLEKEYDFSYTKKRIQHELTRLQIGLAIFQKVKNIRQQQQLFVDEQEALESQKENDERLLIQYQQLFSEILEEYKEKFLVWNEHNTLLKLSDDEMLQIIQLLRLFEVESSYGVIEQIVNTAYFQKFQSLSNDKSEQESNLKQMNTVLLQMHKELEEWENMVDPMPEIDDFMSKNRILLEQKGVDYQPFYRLLDYDEDVVKQDRDRYEEILSRSGLLNAIIVNKKDKQTVLELNEGTADYYLFTDKALDELHIFSITSPMAKEKNIASLLSSFHFEQTHMDGNDQFFVHGILTGTISQEVETKYIGKQSREKFRQQKIAQLQMLIQEHKVKIDLVEKKVKEIHTQIQVVEQEHKTYPKKDDLESAKQDILAKEKDIEVIVRRIQSVLARIQEMETVIIKEKQGIVEIALELGISTSEDIFLQRKQAFEEYGNCLQSFIYSHTSYVSSYEIIAVKQEQLESLTIDVDAIRVEVKNLYQQVDELHARIEQKTKQLDHIGYEQVKQRMEQIQQRLHKLPDLISEEDQKIGNLTSSILQLQHDIEKKQEDLCKQQVLKDKAYGYYLMEAQLNYVVQDDYDDVETIVKQIDQRFPQRKRKDTLLNDLQTSFHMHRGTLQEYNLSMFNVFEEQEETARLDINARYRGVRISFPELLKNLQEDIEKQSILLEDSDRALIEDILVNTISKKIRTHIQSSKRWVSVMNRYMDSMNTSSGLRLNLQWKSHKAENEEELSSEKLVELLEKDVKILKEVDRKHLSSHFRSKIATARKIAEQTDHHESFHQVMRQVMDYRNWFDFRILSQKTGEKKKELTNNAFYAFSGGEKAMAMYIPLFSATAAKFEGARDDAPLLIALDEAFAGVDEKNINNMFDLIGKFKFDYIMNSQVLWGDYPSVKSLAIHELFRPENARFVSVISYEWNGNTKVMVER